ncbi:MAG: hypothetical protein V8Q75_04115 [Bacilli bacterium]
MGKKNNHNSSVNKFINSLSTREKILIMLAVAFIVAFLIFALARYGFGIGNVEDSEIDTNIVEISLDNYKEAVKNKDKTLIYVDNSKESTYKSFRETVESVMAAKDMEMKFLDLDKVKNDDIIVFMEQLDITKDTYMVPLLLVVENGKVVDSNQGILTEIEFQDFLSRNSIAYKKSSNNE